MAKQGDVQRGIPQKCVVFPRNVLYGPTTSCLGVVLNLDANYVAWRSACAQYSLAGCTGGTVPICTTKTFELLFSWGKAGEIPQ
eukprot:1566178-Rhodomonas_salina.1